MFIGEYTHGIDIKRRLAIPSKFRKELGKRAVISSGPDKCLVLYTENEWSKVTGRLAGLPTGKPEARAFTRFFLSGAAEVGIDSLGRILIPDILANYAGLKNEAVLIGVLGRIEIWNKPRWEEYKKKIESSADELAEKLGEIGAY